MSGTIEKDSLTNSWLNKPLMFSTMTVLLRTREAFSWNMSNTWPDTLWHNAIMNESTATAIHHNSLGRLAWTYRSFILLWPLLLPCPRRRSIRRSSISMRCLYWICEFPPLALKSVIVGRTVGFQAIFLCSKAGLQCAWFSQLSSWTPLCPHQPRGVETWGEVA